MKYNRRKNKKPYYSLQSSFNKYEAFSFIVFLLLIILLIAYMIWGFVTSIIFAAIIAGTFSPLFHYLHETKKINKNLSSILVCLLIVLFIFIPGIYIIVQLSEELGSFYNSMRSNLNEKTLNQIFFGDHIFARFTAKSFALLKKEYNMNTINDLISGSLSKVSLSLFNSVNKLISNIFSFIFQFFIMLVAIYSFFMYGKELQQFLLDLSPLKNDDERLIIKQFNMMNYVTLVSNGIGGLIQGVLAGIGFWIAGLPSIILWTIVMIVLAFIPLLGMSIVYIPACIYLYFNGQVFTSIVLFIYCSIIALVVENWFKPKFIGDKIEINSILVFFSIIGGMSVFGMAGIFYGPLIISIFLTVANLYLVKYEKLLLNNSESREQYLKYYNKN